MLWYAFLDLILGGWMASGTIPAERQPPPRPDFRDWARDPEYFEQGKVYLADEEAWIEWFHSFTPDDAIELTGSSSPSDSFPASFPCVVIATRRLGSGLVKAEFYWDFVYPADFPGYVPDSPAGPGPELPPEMGRAW